MAFVILVVHFLTSLARHSLRSWTIVRRSKFRRFWCIKVQAKRKSRFHTLVAQETLHACGCQSIQHEYHDGSVSRKVVRHDGKLLVDEMLSAQ